MYYVAHGSVPEQQRNTQDWACDGSLYAEEELIGLEGSQSAGVRSSTTLCR